MNDTLLGYLEKPGNPIILDSRYFPSKFGGKPAWLNPQNLPQYSDLQCSSCGTRMRFLLQVYAPQDDREDLFHRSIFVFICNNCTSSVQVFRCQLPRKNDYYDYNPAPTDFIFEDISPEKAISELRELKFKNVCISCGIPLSAGTKDQQSNIHDSCTCTDNSVSCKTILDEFSLDIEICSTDEEGEEEDQDEDEQEETENIHVTASDEEMVLNNSEGNLKFEEPLNQSDSIDTKTNQLEQEQRIKSEKQHFENINKQIIDPKSSEYKLFQDYREKFSESIGKSIKYILNIILFHLFRQCFR